MIFIMKCFGFFLLLLFILKLSSHHNQPIGCFLTKLVLLLHTKNLWVKKWPSSGRNIWGLISGCCIIYITINNDESPFSKQPITNLNQCDHINEHLKLNLNRQKLSLWQSYLEWGFFLSLSKAWDLRWGGWLKCFVWCYV